MEFSLAGFPKIYISFSKEIVHDNSLLDFFLVKLRVDDLKLSEFSLDIVSLLLTGLLLMLLCVLD